MSSAIEDLIWNCKTCRKLSGDNQKEPLIQHQYQSILGNISPFIEIDQVNPVTSEKTIKKLKARSTRYGIPEKIQSNNGPQFTSDEFQIFFKKWDIQHVTSSPNFPQSNDHAEKAVDIAGRIINQCQEARKQNYDKGSKDLTKLKDNQPISVKLSKEDARWTKGIVMSCVAPRSHLIHAENVTTGDVELPPEIQPASPHISYPGVPVLKTQENNGTKQIFQDSSYRTQIAPTPPSQIDSNNGSREGLSQPHTTRTGRVVKPRKVMDV
ncbi:hypothetical protein QYM36_002552 [Artemia franciscana]|uniref:Integrase catalytic domain-containing protein n=1 Tax=Artemia franciscana TaxID=6661 RepID=A0AA88I8X1_ARTSF|nr:hypothetical protein QYM36_002552 [Artemia franciscana]